MMRKLLLASSLLLALPLFASASPGEAAEGASAPPSVKELVQKVQTFYESTDGIDTGFEQSFQQAGISSRLGGAAAKGRLRFRKPQGQVGPRMRWDYEDGRVLLLAGDISYTYDPATKQVTSYKMDAASLSAAVTFLWGQGKLLEDFDISLATRTDLGSEGVALELVPKKASGFSKVFLVVDPATGLVRRSVVVQGGGENRITFVDPKIGAVAPLTEFDPDKAFPADAVRVDSPLNR